MDPSAGKENRSGDHRWLILVLAALVIAAFAPLSQLLAGKWARLACDDQAPVLTWTAHELHWRNEGSQGEGLYRDTGRKTRPDPIGARPASVDPRLAIFTYQPIDLNRANAEVLQTIKGIGPKLAAAIVGCRMSKGSFHSLDDLLQIRGVGHAKLAKLRGQLMVAEESSVD